MKYSVLLSALAIAVLPYGVLAQDAQTMADSQPWEFTDPSGRSAELTLNPDGSGRVRLGFGGADATWQETADGLCLTTRPLGRICLALQATTNGFVGIAEDGGQFTFSR